MSSKPATGINHKEFGVTSEGVLIFLRKALIENGIDPDKTPFTVKLTGGPDGDVGGNAIRILFRDYPNTARVVAVADGTGAASDPEGLNAKELVRLVDEGRASQTSTHHFFRHKDLLPDSTLNQK